MRLVAEPSRRTSMDYPGSHPGSGYDSTYYLLRAIKSYSSLSEYNRELVLGRLTELHPKIMFNEETWSGVGRVLANGGLRKAAFHVIEEGGVTLLLMRRLLGFSLGSAVRYLEDLESLGVLRPVAKLLRPEYARGGPRVVVYQTPDADSMQLQHMCDQHRCFEDPLYLRALEASRVLRGSSIVVGDEISYADVVDYLRGSSSTPNVHILAERVVRILVEEGVKVWRR